MIARLVTGRTVVPRLVRSDGVMPPGGDRIPPDFPALGVSPGVLALVLDGMNAVVNEQGGTAYAERITDPGLAMGGKSGTSQVRAITEYEHEHGLRKISQIPWKERDHALFVGFAPVGAPRYVCATVVEHGGVGGGHGSEVAGPICRDVLREVQRRDPARRVPGGDTVAQLHPLDRSPRADAPGG
jgi:penicillin-binding protein 2